MDFKIGDRAVYPAQGVTEILGLESKEIMGTEQEFYVLRVLDSDKKIMIPVDKVTCVGLREVIDKVEVKEVYGILKSSFENNVISPLGLLTAAIAPTTVAMVCLWFLPSL